MKVIEKDWGKQIWLNDYELLMVMKAGGTTSMHKHLHHDTHMRPLSGLMWCKSGGMARYPAPHQPIKAGIEHQIVAETDCVLYERYIPVGPEPEQDIERLT